MSHDTSIFTSHIAAPLLFQLLDGKNYTSWTSHIELWLVGQGYEMHIIETEDDFPTVEHSPWKKVDT